MSKHPPIHFYKSVDSTNDVALSAEPVHGACFAADSQTSGRGRREVGGKRRVWFSPDNVNLYMSVLLTPDFLPSRASGIALAAATGICNVLREQTGLDIWVKWPNDLYIGNKKIAGILTEARTEGPNLEVIVVGIGVNVNVSEDDVPDDLSEIMTSLQIEAGRPFDRLLLLPAVHEVVVDYCDRYADQGYAAIIEELRSYDRTEGKKVAVLLDGDWVEGVSRGIADDGGLEVEVDDEIHRVAAGEVRFR